jgi:acyl dehydratase
VHFDELKPGTVITSERRTVTAQEIIDFGLKYDPQWFHVDPQRARESRWAGLIASGWMTCSIAMQLAVSSVLAGSESIGSPGVEQIKWPNPLRPDAEVQLQMEILENRVSRSGSIGVVRWRWCLTTAAGAIVLDVLGTSLFELTARGESNGESSAV